MTGVYMLCWRCQTGVEINTLKMGINLAALILLLGFYVSAASDYKDSSNRLRRDKERKGIASDFLTYYPQDVRQHLPELSEVNPTQHFPLDGLGAQQLSNLRQFIAGHSICAGCFINDTQDLNSCTDSIIICEAGSMCISASHQGNDQCPMLPFRACCSRSGSNRKCRDNRTGIHPNLPNTDPNFKLCQQFQYVTTTCTGFLCNLEDQLKVQDVLTVINRMSMNIQALDSWSDWSVWSQCAATCGNVNQARLRHCYEANSTTLKNDCVGSSLETRSCPNLQPCPDSWGSWSGWTACTVSCGGGDQFRERHCERSSGSTANDCPGLSIESSRCAPEDCAGVWSEWLSWTSCPSTCGAGIQFRERFCNHPGTTNISNNCLGEGVEQKVCRLMDCPVDGMWGPWGEWGDCLTGSQMRARKCDDPSPQHGGHNCYTDDNVRDVQTQNCDAITTPAPRVLEPPTIYGNASTDSGGNVSLICLTTIAGVSVTWYYKENESLPLYVVQPEGTTHLIITGANVQNIGRYTCLIADKESSSKAQLEVTMRESAARIISLTANPPQLTDGATVQLECRALGYPEPVIRWGYKDTFGNPYVPPPVKYTDGGKTIVIASYQSILYGGTWTCNAVNKLGTDHRDITI